MSSDPVAFLRGTPPFEALPPALFDAAMRSLDVVTHDRGAVLVHRDGGRLQHLYVILKGSVRLERDGETLQLLEEGETFGYTSIITGRASLDVVVEEDLVAARIPEEEFRALLGDARFAGHFALGLSERLNASLDRSPMATLKTDLSRRVDQLVRRPAVWVEPDATVAEAARQMRSERISSLLVRTSPAGIVTDRDFRNRVLAEDLGPSTPVRQVMSQPLRVVDATTPVFEAWQILLDGGLHHLPVARGDEILGVLTSTDLVRFTPHSPVSFVERIERLASRDDLVGYAGKAADMVSALHAGGLDALLIGGFVARLNDALLTRLVEWAEAELGPAPAPYAWIVFGSEGREEQLLLTDQDNALVFDDAGVPHRAWFQKFVERINADLEAAGFPPCPGGYMARQWNGPMSEWIERFSGWIEVPNTQAMLVASIFFDFRKVQGALDLSPLESLLARSGGKALFLRELARDALHFRPPPTLLLRLRGSSSSIDLKNHALRAIVSLARCYGLEASSRIRGTIPRLEAALRAGLIDDGTCAMVGEAYRFLVGLRLRLQLRALPSSKTDSAKVTLAELTPIERTRLKDCFRAITTWQAMASHQFHVDR